MLTSPYSIDLRKKVISFLKIGNSQKEAARVFEISPTTVNKWHVRYKKEGHFLPRKRIGAKVGIDKSKFIEYVLQNPNAKAADIGKIFSISASGTRYWLKVLGFGYKKSLHLHGSKSREKKQISRRDQRYSMG